MVKIKDAKPLFAISTFLFPWDVFVLGQNLGWGLTFGFGRYVVTQRGSGVLFTTFYLQHLGQVDILSGIGFVLWALAGVLVLAAGVLAASVRFDWVSRSSGSHERIGLLISIGAVAFLLSRFFTYDFLLVSGSQNPEWFSIPFGVLYLAFVGYLFYFDRFRLGAS